MSVINQTIYVFKVTRCVATVCRACLNARPRSCPEACVSADDKAVWADRLPANLTRVAAASKLAAAVN